MNLQVFISFSTFLITLRQFTKKLIIKKNFNIVFINKRKHNIRICERNFEIETEKEIGNNDLIKTDFNSKKNKINIKKCYNDLIFLHVFYNEFSRIQCSCLSIDIILFDLRKLIIIEFSYIFFL